MTTDLFSQFKALHYQSTPLLLPNAWDAASTVLLQIDGAAAIATSSSAVAWSLGYADGGALPRDELLGAVRRIMRVARVPVSIDMEDGYSDDPHAVAEMVVQVARCGVVGINLEDGKGSMDLLTRKIAAIRQALAGTPLFINARTDVYLKGLAKNDKGENGEAAMELCVQRLQNYRAAGADGAFVPGMSTTLDAARLVPQIDMPLNLMVVPTLAPIADLAAAGVRRISAGGALFQTTYAYSRRQAKRFMGDGDSACLFEHALPYAFMNSEIQALHN
jgi:2-methylisocitrate lyase-like PEP mutase family enzyme